MIVVAEHLLGIFIVWVVFATAMGLFLGKAIKLGGSTSE